jgi:hypothetical protein
MLSLEGEQDEKGGDSVREQINRARASVPQRSTSLISFLSVWPAAT